MTACLSFFYVVFFYSCTVKRILSGIPGIRSAVIVPPRERMVA